LRILIYIIRVTTPWNLNISLRSRICSV
jgi:hypothetical protein